MVLKTGRDGVEEPSIAMFEGNSENGIRVLILPYCIGLDVVWSCALLFQMKSKERIKDAVARRLRKVVESMCKLVLRQVMKYGWDISVFIIAKLAHC